jgi:hypothetical protein
MGTQDVSVRVAEPGLTEAASGRDAVLGLDLREVVLFEAPATVVRLVDGGSA